MGIPSCCYIIDRLVLKFNLAVSGTQESISLSGVPMKAKELCDILNKMLKNANKGETVISVISV